MSIKVLLVDDSAVIRQQLTHELAAFPEFRVAGRAGNGQDALKMAELVKPDVIILDIEMPVMDGLETLAHIMAIKKTPVVVFSSLTTSGAQATMRAFDLGAVDVALKPSSPEEWPEKIKELVIKLRAAAGANLTTDCASAAPTPIYSRRQFDIVLIGCSTGGPATLNKIIPALNVDFPLPILIAQHIPSGFTQTMANRLSGFSKLSVHEAWDGCIPKPGNVYIAPGGTQTTIKESGKLQVGNYPGYSGLYKPSVDLLFIQAAKNLGARVLALVLTGMGKDGALGAKDLAEAGAVTIVQNRKSCIVDGMPSAVISGGWARAELDPMGLVSVLNRL